MKKYFWWTVGIIATLYLLLVVVRIFHFIDQKKTDEQVAKINATKLTLDDVMGKNLPPDPGAEADKTIEGVDANKNGIRDDVELAIFNAYPNSAKTRAVLLQYALALQMEMTQPVVNTQTVTAVAQAGERSSICIGSLLPRNNLQNYVQGTRDLSSFVEDKELNNDLRRKAQNAFYEQLGAHDVPRESCDLDISALPN